MFLTDLDPIWTAGWSTLALLNAGLAQGKGRSSMGWLLLSLMAGPLATALLLRLATPHMRHRIVV